MDKNDIIEYVMHTPHNTNRAVLSSMLNQLAKGGSDDSWTVLTEESVTTITYEGDSYASGKITYVELITEDTIKITFNDMEYTCQNDSDGIMNHFGAPWSDELNGYDFSVCPFAISSIGIQGSARNTLYTETAGTYTIKIEAPQSGGSSDFSTATVTIVNAGTTSGAFGDVFGSMPICHEAGELGPEAPAFIESTFGIEPEATGVFVVPIYKNGMVDASFDSVMTIVSVTGNAMWDEEDYDVYITGDCTITAQRSIIGP